jgi:hypothetical protein
MEVQDGFILGVYNYCDRWCETCPVTSRCRVFVDRAEFDAGLDANLRPVLDAPPLPQDVPPPVPRWLQECIDEMNETARPPVAAGDMAHLFPDVAPEHQPIEKRARAYSFDAAGWLQTVEPPAAHDHPDPRSVVLHYCAFIPPKVHRALIGLSCWKQDPDLTDDHIGSAKIALIAIDRSRAAWIALADRGLASVADAARFVFVLGRLADDLERVFPNARSFVRPGLDEPDQVAKLG